MRLPTPHSAALLTPGEMTVTNATESRATNPATAERRSIPFHLGLLRPPRPLLSPEFTLRGTRCHRTCDLDGDELRLRLRVAPRRAINGALERATGIEVATST